MKLRAKKTYFRTAFAAVPGLRSFRHFDNSNFGRLLPLALLLAFSQFCASADPTKSPEQAKVYDVARTASIASDGNAYSPNAASNSIDGALTCITAENQEKQPAPDGGDSPNSPDATSDIEDSDGLDDLRADPSLRDDRDTPHFSITGVGAGATRLPRIVRALLLPVHCFYCLHEHIRERAPPSLALTI